MPPGGKIGRYDIEAVAGEGGMGTVYRARDPKLGRTVAIKVLRVGFESEERQRRFTREASALGRLQHPNIVVVHDYGEDQEERPFIVMEYVDGETVAQLVARLAPLSIARKLHLMEMLCAGLAHAHRLGIVHRDIKPGNLVVDSTGTLKILDFGIVQWTSAETTSLTELGRVAGSPCYMSPEQIQGRRVGPASDQFSAGLVFYELLSFRRAFGGNAREVLTAILATQPEPLANLCSDLDPEVERIVARALEKSSGRRFPDIEAMRRAIARARARIETPEQATQPLRAPGVVATGDLTPVIAPDVAAAGEVFRTFSGSPEPRAGGPLRWILGGLAGLLVAAWLLWPPRPAPEANAPADDRPRTTVSSDPAEAAGVQPAAEGEGAPRAARSPATPPNPSAASAALAQARELLDGGQVRVAFEVVKKALDRSPHNEALLAFMGDMEAPARLKSREARLTATATGAAELAVNLFENAQATERAAETAADDARPAEVVSLYLQAEDLFRAASRAAVAASRATVTGPAPPLPPEPRLEGVPSMTGEPVGDPAVSTSQADDPPPDPLAEAAVRQALDGYVRAYATLSAASVKAVYPGLTAGEVRALDRSFLDYASYSMIISNLRPSIRVNRAMVQCVVESTIVPRDGAERHIVEPTTFMLEKLADSWVIVRIERAR